MAENKEHPFRKSLGIGPYSYVGFVEIKLDPRRGTVVTGDTHLKVENGFGTCDHCSHGIMNCYIVRNGEGKLYSVGSECIMKTDADDQYDMDEVVRAVKRKKNAMISAKRQDKAFKARVEAKAWIEANADTLKSMPHPNAYFASQGKTKYDWLMYYLPKNAEEAKHKAGL